jgi:hypothetical protein
METRQVQVRVGDLEFQLFTQCLVEYWCSECGRKWAEWQFIPTSQNRNRQCKCGAMPCDCHVCRGET